MLDDRDRNARYNEAIRACINDFNRDNPDLGGPRVLDVGVGTGFLSACCLLAGAKHVTGVDVTIRFELRYASCTITPLAPFPAARIFAAPRLAF